MDRVVERTCIAREVVLRTTGDKRDKKERYVQNDKARGGEKEVERIYIYTTGNNKIRDKIDRTRLLQQWYLEDPWDNAPGGLVSYMRPRSRCQTFISFRLCA